jgi:hypothetical protein
MMKVSIFSPFNYIFRAAFLHRQKLMEGMIKQNSNADLVFMMDCTGSMASHIETTKSQIANIVNVCVAEFENQVTEDNCFRFTCKPEIWASSTFLKQLPRSYMFFLRIHYGNSNVTTMVKLSCDQSHKSKLTSKNFH